MQHCILICINVVVNLPTGIKYISAILSSYLLISIDKCSFYPVAVRWRFNGLFQINSPCLWIEYLLEVSNKIAIIATFCSPHAIKYHPHKEQCTTYPYWSYWWLSLLGTVSKLVNSWWFVAPLAIGIWVNIGSAKGVLPGGTKPLPEPMLTHLQRFFAVYTWERFNNKCLWS